MGTKVYHYTSMGLLALTPVAIVASPSVLNVPIDLIIGFLIPLHSHIGLNYVVSDYVPKALRTVARASVLGLSVIMAAGLLKINLHGVGITETVKHLWRKGDSKGH